MDKLCSGTPVKIVWMTGDTGGMTSVCPTVLMPPSPVISDSVSFSPAHGD